MNEIEKYMNRAYTYTNLAYLLADVCETYMGETEQALRKARSRKVIRFEEKKNFNDMLSRVQAARKKMREVTKPMYDIPDADSACVDSDWFADFIFLLTDRIGKDADTQTKIRSMIFNLKSNLNLYGSQLPTS